ncbi:MAG: acyltransferase family protein [Planktomarina sp.]
MTNQGAMPYRADLDGIRAIAVLAVLGFHASIFSIGTGFASGGYAGVDVFFVLSGFLITRQLMQHAPSTLRDILQFYRRRMLRLMPAILTVLLVTTLVASQFFLAEELLSLVKHGFGGALGVLNFRLAMGVGYFDAVAETKPFLHLWSLSVEVQFYTLLPILVVSLRRHQTALFYTILGISCASFASAQLAYVIQPSWGFYLFPPRCWEFGVGILLALKIDMIRLPLGLSLIWRNVITFLALAGLAGSFFVLDAYSGGAPMVMLWPVGLTAVLIVMAPVAPVVHSILSWPVLRRVGQLSYTLYLWHWPMLVLISLGLMRRLWVTEIIGVMVLIFMLSGITWIWIEKPCRKNTKSNFWGVIGALFITLIVFSGVWTQRGLVKVLPADAEWARAYQDDYSRRSRACAVANHNVDDDNEYVPPADCLPKGMVDLPSPAIAVLGDSHGHAMIQALRDRNLPILQLTHDGCAPVLDVEPVVETDTAIAQCAAYNPAVFEYLLPLEAVDTIMIVARWPLYFEGTRMGHKNGWTEGGKSQAIQPRGFTGDDMARKRQLSVAFGAVADRWLQAGKTVILVYPTPEMGVNVPQVVARSIIFGRDVPKGIRYDEYLMRVRPIHNIFDHIEDHVDLHRIQPSQVLCPEGDTQLCLFGDPDGLYYFDDDHLSHHGATKVVEYMMQELPWLAELTMKEH